MKTLSAVFSSPANERLTRLAVSALEAEVNLRGSQLAVSHDSLRRRGFRCRGDLDGGWVASYWFPTAESSF